MKTPPKILFGIAVLFLALAVTADAAIPTITIDSPINKTYETSIDLNWSADETLDSCDVQLNDGVNSSLKYWYSNTSLDVADEPIDITLNDTKFWIITGGREIREYWINGTFISIINDSLGYSPGGITQNTSHFWIVDTEAKKVYQYWMNGSYTGNSFAITEAGSGSRGITQNGTYFWIVGVGNERVYQYWMNGSYTGINFDISGELSSFSRSITQDNNNFWLPANGQDFIYQYSMNGSYTGISIPTPAMAGGWTFGVAQDGTHLWITVFNTDKIFKYYMYKTCSNITFTAQEGSNTLYVWANDTTGDMNYARVVFTLDTTTLLRNCSSNLTDAKTLTFHVFEEENRTAMNATMEITLWLRNDSVTSEYSFKFENNDTYHICIYPSWEEYEVDATIEYYETGYTRRNYFFNNATINNATSDINLYLLSSSLATDTKFIVKDVYHNLQDNVIIRAQRFYTESNEYIAVAMGRTGFDGVSGIPLKHNTWYRYILERDYGVLRTFNPMYLTEAELELYLSVEETIEYFEYYQSVASACNYNNDTLYLVCSVSDTSGKMVEAVLMVEERKLLGDWENVCLNTTISSSTTLTCDLSGHQNKTLQYALRGRFCCSQETYFTLATGTLDLSSAALLSLGIIGVLMAFFLVITLGFIGIWNPAVGIVFMIFGLFISISLGLVTGTPEIYTSFIALTVAASLIVYKLKV